jgi:hypothetical protein
LASEVEKQLHTPQVDEVRNLDLLFCTHLFMADGHILPIGWLR